MEGKQLANSGPMELQMHDTLSRLDEVIDLSAKVLSSRSLTFRVLLDKLGAGRGAQIVQAKQRICEFSPKKLHRNYAAAGRNPAARATNKRTAFGELF